VTNGVPQAHIIDGRQLHSLLLEVFTSEGIGTMIIPDAEADRVARLRADDELDPGDDAHPDDAHPDDSDADVGHPPGDVAAPDGEA
jgi:hypothetical protein